MNPFNIDLFLYVCEKNDLELVIDIYNKNKEIIENSTIKRFNKRLKVLEFVFLVSIYSNYIDLMKWVFSLNKIDISFHRNYYYYIACVNKNKYILDWFHDINPKYNYVIEKNIFKPNIKGTPPYFIRNGEWEELIQFLKIKTNNDLEFEKCAICYEKSNILTSCKHYFCLECLGKWYISCNTYKETCPYCRNKLKMSECVYKEFK